MVPGNVARISDPSRFRIQESVAIPPIIIPKIETKPTCGPGDPFSVVAVHGDRRAGGSVAVATAGDPPRKYYGMKATRRSLMLPPC